METFRGLLTAVVFTAILAGLVIFGFCMGRAYGQTWHPANQATVGWDAVTTLANGDPLPAGDEIRYSVVRAGADKQNPVVVADRILETQFTVTFEQEGRYLLGVYAHRIADGEEVGSTGDNISWSDDPERTGADGPFGALFFVQVEVVKGLHVQ